MFIYKFIIINILIIYSSLGEILEENDYSGSKCFIDSKKGIIMYDDGPVFIYDYMIFMPIAINIPRVEVIQKEESCQLKVELNKRMQEVLEILQNKIPNTSNLLLSFNTSKHSSTDELKITPEKIYINPDRRMYLDESDYLPKTIDLIGHHLDTERRTKYSRRRRFALIVIMAILGTLSLAAVAGAITGSVALGKINTIKSNQALIANKINEQTEGLNLINVNQEHLVSITQNITFSLNNLIKDHQCLKYTVEEQLKLINSWSTIVPNSFIRALNGFISGEVNMDIIPGDQIRMVMGMYPSFSETIFEENPFLLYKSSKSKLITVSKNPLIIEGLIVTPRIRKQIFGRRYVQKSCTWAQNGVYYSLKEELPVIKRESDGTWWDTTECDYQDGVTLCDKRKMRSLKNKCLGEGKEWDISSCHLTKHTNIERDQVIQTPNGLLVCDKNSHIVLFKADAFHVLNTRKLTIKHPTLITSKMADNILVGTNHYPIIHGGPLLNITELIIIHNDSDNMSQFDKVDIDFNLTHVKKIEKLSLNMGYHTFGISFTTILIVSVCVVGVYFYIKNLKRNRVMKKRIGYMSYQLSSDGKYNNQDGLEIKENEDSNSIINN